MTKPRKKTTAELVQEGNNRADAGQARTPISVLVDNVRSLDNVGMIFRLCELARIEHLYLGGYTGYPRLEGDTRPETVIERHVRRIEKTAVFAVPLQPWSYHPNSVAEVKKRQEKGEMIVVLEQTDRSKPYQTQDYSLPLLLVVGHEREGVRQEIIEMADAIIEIPILGQGNSHNVATATGIILYEMLRIKGLLRLPQQ